MTYLERYSAGEHVEIWDELQALGNAVRDPAVLADALSVARATMDRVALNIERLADRLTSYGYEFGIYPDGSKLHIERGGVTRPTSESLGHIDELERLAGTIPLSLRAFWECVGSVSFIGRAQAGWPDYSDPLCVEGPRTGILEFYDWQRDANPLTGAPGGEPFLCPIAPDFLHKDNVSGGRPYGIQLPDSKADAVLQQEWHHIRFVPYLRIAILDWGGFPGLSPANPYDKWRSRRADRVAPTWFEELRRDLAPF